MSFYDRRQTQESPIPNDERPTVESQLSLNQPTTMRNQPSSKSKHGLHTLSTGDYHYASKNIPLTHQKSLDGAQTKQKFR